MKNKIYLLLFIMILMQIPLSICGCGEKDYSNYKNEDGYAEYVSYADKGCKYASYYDIPESIVENEKALKYYKNNVRQCGDFLITNYLDGICVIDYAGEVIANEIAIPETIEGKPVIAMGAYFHNTYRNSDYVYDRFSGIFDNRGDPNDCYYLNVRLPAGLKYISEFNASPDGLTSLKFFVDEENPYYASENGNLYTKDMKTLLYLSDSDNISPITENFVESTISNYEPFY